MYTISIEGHTSPLYLREDSGSWYLTEDVTDVVYMSKSFNDVAAAALGKIVYGDKERPYQDSNVSSKKGTLRVRNIHFEPKTVDLDLSKVSGELRVGKEVFVSIDDVMMHVNAGVAHMYCTTEETKALAREEFKQKSRSDCAYQVVKVSNLEHPDVKPADILFPFSEYSGLIVNECYEVIESANKEALFENIGCDIERFDYFIVKKH